MLDVKTIRKVLMTAVVVALATTPVAAKDDDCELKPMHKGLFCTEERPIEVCQFSDDECTVDCGRGAIEVGC